MRDTIKNYVLEQFQNNNNVRVNITQIGYEPDFKYNTVVGVRVNDELKEVFELENISNNEIEEFKKELNDIISRNTLYII